MLLVDARRLTGPNLLARKPLVVVELGLDVPDVFEHARDVYFQELRRMRAALGFFDEVVPVLRIHRGGAVLAYEAPLDVMLPAAEMSEWAALSACEILRGREPFDLEPKRTEIEAMLVKDRSAALLRLAAEAGARGVPFLWDDETVSVGGGSRSMSWARGEIPDASAVPWDRIGTIPVALVTGTNGKTTSSRLLARVVAEAGHRVGATSSDAITINGTAIDEGDWTGPAAARAVLRHPDVDFAVLETARGGILRRGLAIDICDAGLITNVSEDHGGGYGIDDLAAMAEVKAVVAQAVKPGGTAVLNAADPRLVGLGVGKTLAASVVFFADLDGDGAAASPARMMIESQRTAGKRVVYAEGGAIWRADGIAPPVSLGGVDAIPITFRGAARFNVENVLGVVAMASALGIPDDAIVRGLTGFQLEDNPRRGYLLERAGVRIMLDFGHNPEGVRAVLSLVERLRGGTGDLYVIAGSAGDRSDHEIEGMAEAIAKVKPHRVLLRDLGGYLRGRLPGDVPRVFERGLAGHGVAPAAIVRAASEVDAFEKVKAEAKAGDFVLLLVHLDHDEVQSFLARWT
jgi:cyanophycin synthetase